LSGQPSVYVEGMAFEALAGWANVVATPEEADIAIVRTSAPWEERGRPGDIDSFFHAGSLEFHADELAHLAELAAKLPLVVDVFLDRPGILAPVVELASAVIGNFGSTDAALAQVLFGAAEPMGGSRSRSRPRWRRCWRTCRTSRTTQPTRPSLSASDCGTTASARPSVPTRVRPPRP
jgi:hypothetical protein